MASSVSSTSTSSTTNASVTVVAPALKKRSLIPAKWKEAVRVVGMSECREAALTLAHAFAADDYAQYLVDDHPGDMHGRDRDGGISTEESKWKLHVDILTYTVASHCMSGLVTAVGPEYDSVALWVPPGKHLDGWWTQLRSGMWRLYFQLSPEGKKRYFQEILPLLHDTKAEVLGDRDHDAWYLVYLGTKPNSQGRGYAARLLQDMMARADAENRPMYLESSSQANNAYYEKFGFEVKRDVFLERGPVPVRLSIMVREPRVPGCKVAHPSPSSMVKKFGAGNKGLMG
ncbi:puromycin N-acetyltransferase [Achaetomium macrosporum]|uniref:Puromycin N-acetyltransferase n=1 Tax=Achaetomium macrosporum TaxID=79813 RepID=A0AAN7C6A4_9PEZI|nr:puromycin N-acetyltransferase [Achaetomium macrosporum]